MRIFRNAERNLHCDVVHITTKWVSSLSLDCNGVFAIKAYATRNDIVDDFVTMCTLDAIFATLKSIATCGIAFPLVFLYIASTILTSDSGAPIHLRVAVAIFRGTVFNRNGFIVIHVYSMR